MAIFKEKHYQLALAMVPGIGCKLFKKLLGHFGSAQAVFKAAYSGHPLLPPQMAQRIISNGNFKAVKKSIELHTTADIQLITQESTDYPQRLLALPDAPPILYYKGEILLNNQRIISIVGTRQLTSYGQKAITNFLEQLLPYQPVIVSGLAYGTDIWAHQQALTIGLPTVAVLPTALNKIYPSVHTAIAIQICQSAGGLLTEYPIGSKPNSYAFVARNRITAGLSDATIVIEAKEKSGSLITAYYANNYHREVFALPGDIYVATSTGCHKLIKRNQAHILTHIDDLAYIMNWKPATKTQSQQTVYANHPLTPSEQIVVTKLQASAAPLSIDNLIATTTLPLGELQAILLSLELQGLIRVLPGKNFTLIHRK